MGAPAPRDMALGRRLAVARRDRVLTRLRDVFIFMAFAIYSGALMPSLRNLRNAPHLQAGETDPFGTISQAVILAVVSIYLLRNWQRVREATRPMTPYLVIVALCAASSLWSDYPFASVRRSVTLATCLGFGLFCHLELGLAGTITRLGRSMTLLCLASLLVWLAVPSVGSETLLGYEGALRGVFSTKNETGTAVELATSYYIYLALRERRLVRPVIALALLLTCLVLVRSSTATSICLAMLVGGSIAYLWRSRLIALLLFTMASLCVAFAALTFLDPALPFELLGRDTNLTGRSPLWQASIEVMAQRPWLGYGYSGFWHADSRMVQQIWRMIGWEAPSAHNGYVDTMLQLGVAGLALFLWLWGRIIYDAVTALRRDGMPEASWILLMMTADAMLNFSEGTMSYPDLFTAMMPTVIVTLSEARRARMAGVATARRRQKAAVWRRSAGDHAQPAAGVEAAPRGAAR